MAVARKPQPSITRVAISTVPGSGTGEAGGTGDDKTGQQGAPRVQHGHQNPARKASEGAEYTIGADDPCGGEQR